MSSLEEQIVASAEMKHEQADKAHELLIQNNKDSDEKHECFGQVIGASFALQELLAEAVIVVGNSDEETAAQQTVKKEAASGGQKPTKQLMGNLIGSMPITSLQSMMVMVLVKILLPLKAKVPQLQWELPMFASTMMLAKRWLLLAAKLPQLRQMPPPPMTATLAQKMMLASMTMLAAMLPQLW